jgi:hypothetical protein
MPSIRPSLRDDASIFFSSNSIDPSRAASASVGRGSFERRELPVEIDHARPVFPTRAGRNLGHGPVYFAAATASKST